MRSSSSLLLLSVIIGLVACDPEPTQSKNDAQVGWRNTQTALEGAGATVVKLGGSVSPDGISGVAMGDVDCAGGGSLHVSASGDVDASKVEGEVRIDFASCTVDGVTIDGYLDYAAVVEEDRVAAEYHGDLEWSGAVSGSCAIDASAEVTTDGVSAGVKLTGGVCGHDWADLAG